MFRTLFWVAAATFALMTSAQAQSTAPTRDTVSAPPIAMSATAKAEPAYFIVTRVDLRKCAHPMCGGYFVKAVNSPSTRCADGTLAKECHALELDTRALGWSDEQRAKFEASFSQGRALVKGALATQPRGLASAEVLRVSQAWQGQGSGKRPIGTFYSLRNNGIVCIQAPCPSLSLTRLNRPAPERNIDAVDFGLAHAPDSAIQAAWAHLEQGPILVAGAVLPFTAGGLQGPVQGHRLLASEFYLPARP